MGVVAAGVNEQFPQRTPNRNFLMNTRKNTGERPFLVSAGCEAVLIFGVSEFQA
jgi:hypothetical protein